jgi:hypothetical protein
MKHLSGNIFGAEGYQWFCLKLSLVFCWQGSLVYMAGAYSSCPFPVGICKLYNFDPLFSVYGLPVLIAALCILSLLYLFEAKMVYTTLCMSVLSCIIVSHHESNGVFQRATPYTTIFVAQFFAYLGYKLNHQFDLARFRVQYCVQIIGATYLLSAITKLKAAGLGWVNGAEVLPIHVMKGASFVYFTTGLKQALDNGYSMAYWLHGHVALVKWLFAGTLFLELTCFIAAFNNYVKVFYGIGLALMHLGIYVAMNILIAPLACPMMIFFLNPLYWVTTLPVRLFKRFITGDFKLRMG